VGVSVIAILACVGSAFTLLVAVFVASMMLLLPTLPQNSQAPGFPMRAVMALVMAVYLAPAIWGLCSGIGLWRLKNWARICTLVFAGLLCCMGLFGGLVALVMPIPVTAAQQAQMPEIGTVMKVWTIGLALAQLGVGVWWLIFFLRPKVIAQFEPLRPPVPFQGEMPIGEAAMVAPPSITGGRPVSITVIACLLFVGTAFFPFLMLMHTPTLFLGKILTGPAAVGILLAFMVAHVGIGVGLLKVQPWARVAGLLYFGFALVNGSLTWLRPDAQELMRTMMKSQSSMFGPVPLIELPRAYFIVMAILGIVVAAIPMYFLATRKAAFERTGV
jgi:hypothetical protein